jgi:hypothetical protein
MNQEQKELLLTNAKDFFREQIIESHMIGGCERAAKLSEYNINPFLTSYIANFTEGSLTPITMAKALVLPRLMGTSINTIFGMHAQRMISELFEGFGSAANGMDIEFIDSIDGRKKYCQIKAGPDTINADDVVTITNHFGGVKRLARANNLDLRETDLIVGVLYGEQENISNHYKKINQSFPVYAGQDFWHRLTGSKSFYLELSTAIGDVANEVNGKELLNDTIRKLSLQLQEVYFDVE